MTESQGFGEGNTISIVGKDWKAFLNPNRRPATVGQRRFRRAFESYLATTTLLAMFCTAWRNAPSMVTTKL